MVTLWRAVGYYHQVPRLQCAWAGGGGDDAGEYRINDGLLRLALERGHPALAYDDDDAEVLDAQVHIRDTLNSNRDGWPETFGMTEAEWAAMHAEGDAIRAARAAATAADGEGAAV